MGRAMGADPSLPLGNLEGENRQEDAGSPAVAVSRAPFPDGFEKRCRDGGREERGGPGGAEAEPRQEGDGARRTASF